MTEMWSAVAVACIFTGSVMVIVGTAGLVRNLLFANRKTHWFESDEYKEAVYKAGESDE